MIFARKINKIPQFYMIFARKMPKFYIIIARKIFSRILGARAPCFPVSSPTPMLGASVRPNMLNYYALSPIHTADADETKLSSLVASASAVCT